MVLGPFAGLISMTITLVIQAGIGDGGITTFGANVFNMAVIGVLSFFVVKGFLSKGFTTKWLAIGMFLASFISNVCTALAVGIEIGLFPMVGNLGGIFVTVPSMLMWYVPTGIIEGVVSSTLIVSLSKLNGVKLLGLEMYHNDLARIEVGKDENILLCHVEVQDKINSELRKLGFKYVTVDLEGYQTGSMLRTLDKSKQPV
jgi:hypothetical protein